MGRIIGAMLFLNLWGGPKTNLVKTNQDNFQRSSLTNQRGTVMSRPTVTLICAFITILSRFVCQRDMLCLVIVCVVRILQELLLD